MPLCFPLFPHEASLLALYRPCFSLPFPSRSCSCYSTNPRPYSILSRGPLPAPLPSVTSQTGQKSIGNGNSKAMAAAQSRSHVVQSIRTDGSIFKSGECDLWMAAARSQKRRTGPSVRSAYSFPFVSGISSSQGRRSRGQKSALLPFYVLSVVPTYNGTAHGEIVYPKRGNRARTRPQAAQTLIRIMFQKGPKNFIIYIKCQGERIRTIPAHTARSFGVTPTYESGTSRFYVRLPNGSTGYFTK